MFKKNFTTEMSGDKKAIEKRFTAISGNKKRGIITGISVLTAVIIIGGAIVINGIATDSTEIYSNNADTVISATTHPYNEGFVDITGKTVAEIANEEGKTLEEFLASYDLPADMPADTNETAAYAMIPCHRMAAMYNMSFEELMQKMHFADFVTESTPWGQALDEVTLGDYVGRDHIEEFKSYYGLGDEINADTKWKEVRIPIEEGQRQDRLKHIEENN